MVFLLVLLGGAGTLAHDSRPVYVEITELDDALYLLSWKTPGSVAAANIPDVRLVAPCELQQPKGAPLPVSALHAQQAIYVCAGKEGPDAMSLHYPSANPSLATIVRLQRKNSSPEVIYASPQTQQISFSGAHGALAVLWQYIQLGVQHIAGGYDHLLFVACLVLLAVSFKRIVWAITGFTLAHSITLSLATLDLVRVPIVPVEAVIALSIVFLAAELARDNTSTLARRFPGLVALLFGLLHGFGFASVLQEIGLPAGERFVALFAFNLGVELGQLGFVGVLLIALRLVWLRVEPQQLNRLIVYPVGLIASFWLWQRLNDFV